MVLKMNTGITFNPICISHSLYVSKRIASDAYIAVKEQLKGLLSALQKNNCSLIQDLNFTCF